MEQLGRRIICLAVFVVLLRTTIAAYPGLYCDTVSNRCQEIPGCYDQLQMDIFALYSQCFDLDVGVSECPAKCYRALQEFVAKSETHYQITVCDCSQEGRSGIYLNTQMCQATRGLYQPCVGALQVEE
ncbi:uncharacterized protein LOC102806666 [Saccoglossus kowalevskii]|uniref:Uncharacterized protein LOC102806666 n=1 Tax=Saccoglossus kowalevskii TaxID=10224 RepID=A0ABM0M9R7_SACKO|nr:PREDICTED: uncharacterized protein LOC102806666 [Saccoglossus kowalevskii]